MRKIAFFLVVAGAFGWTVSAYAETRVAANTCTVCDQYGDKCCAHSSTMAGCIACSIQYETKEYATKWCHQNQPVCRRK